MYYNVNIRLLVRCENHFPQDVSQFDLTRKRISSSSEKKYVWSILIKDIQEFSARKLITITQTLSRKFYEFCRISIVRNYSEKKVFAKTFKCKGTIDNSW